jgi:hypothetical protein
MGFASMPEAVIDLQFLTIYSEKEILPLGGSLLLLPALQGSLDELQHKEDIMVLRASEPGNTSELSKPNKDFSSRV